MSEAVDHEISGIPTYPNWPEIVGPFYKIDGKANVLYFCRESWQEDKIPFLYGRKQIGKTGILTPYLRSALGGDVAIFEPGSAELRNLTELPRNSIVLAAVHGKENVYYDRQCDIQIENMCVGTNLFKPDMFKRGRIELRLDDDDVGCMVRQLTGVDTKGLGIKCLLGKRKIVSAFHQDRPISKGIEVLEELLGNRFPKH